MIKTLKSDNESSLSTELLEHAEGDGRQALQAFLQSVSSNDRNQARYYAHKLKGMTSNLGLKRLHRIFQELEDRAKTEEVDMLSAAEAETVQALFRQSLDEYREYTQQ